MAHRPIDDRPSGFWDDFFLTMADHVATASKDPSTKVGCVLIDAKRRVIGVGYNGFPRGVQDLPERYADRPTKYMMVQHAEANAVLQATVPTEGATAYVTHPPCASCAGILIQAGVKRIVTSMPSEELRKRFADSFDASDLMFGEAGVKQTFIARS